MYGPGLRFNPDNAESQSSASQGNPVQIPIKVLKYKICDKQTSMQAPLNDASMR